MRASTVRFAANGAGVAAACAHAERFLTQQKLGAREVKRLRFTVETLLRRVGERLGRATECTMTLRRRMGRAELCIRYAGAEYDPTTAWREDEGNIWSERLLAELGLVPEWSRRRGVNCLTLGVRRRDGGVWLAQGAALALAAIVCLALPAPWLEAAERSLLSPLYDLLCGAWGILSAPLVFFSIVSLVCGMGDTLLLGRTGKQMLTRFIVLTGAWAAFGTAALAALLPLDFAPVRGGSWASRLAETLRRALPREGLPRELTPVVLCALAVGVALTLLGGRTSLVREWSEQCARLVRALARSLCRLTPLFIVCAAPRLLRGGAWRGLWRPLALFLLLVLALTVGKLAVVCALRREKAFPRLKSLLPPVKAAFAAVSPDAAFGAALDNCENVLGIAHDHLLLALPIGNALCVPADALCCGTAALCLAAERGVGVDALSLLGLALTGVLLALALPREAGVRVPAFALLLRQLGLPGDGIAAMTALSLFFDAIAAVASVWYLQLELLRQEALAAGEKN